MVYHKSIFNYIYKKSNNNWVIYNTFSGSIILIDDESKKKFDNLEDNNIKNNSKFIDDLIKQGILIDNEHDEKKLIDASRARRTFGEKAAYLRILTTTACNARCSYCYEKGFKTETMDENTTEAVIKYILRLPKMEKFYIHWFGGEPLLNTKVIDKVMSAVYDKLKLNGTQVYVYFTSNGSMLDREMCHKAKDLWHASYFQITIDDIGKKYDNIKKYINKKYNYDKVIQNIKYLLKEKIKVILRINYYPDEVKKVKNIIDVLSEDFMDACKNGLLIFDPAPIFDSNSVSCSNCEKVYNMSDPAKYLIEKGFLREEDAINLKFKGGQCYACHQGSFTVAPNGDLYKCTVTMRDKGAVVGNIFNGVDRNNYYFKWVNPNLPEKCNKCVFLPLCQGGCRAGELGYLSVFCKRNLSEVKSMINFKIENMLKKKIKLIPFKESVGKDLYQMYQDIPKEEVGSINNLNGINYEEFKKKCEELIKEEKIINEEIHTTTSRFILYNDYKPIGEIGIRTTLNDFWENKGSQIYYKIRKSERKKGYGNLILKLGLLEARKLGFNKIRINCDDNNTASKKIIIKNGGIVDIKSYKTNDGFSSSYIIKLNEK